MRKLGWLLWKDVVSESRSLERLSTLVLFTVAVLVTLHFSLPPESEARPMVAAGFLWAAVVFAAVLEFRRSFTSEQHDGTLEGLRSAPVEASVLFGAKALSSFVVLGVLSCALVPLTALFFGGRMDAVGPAIAVTLAGIVGLVAWGTLFAAVAAGARAGEIVLPVLLFPLLVPQTIACVRLLAWLLGDQPLDDPLTGLLLLGSFDVLSIGTSLLLFDYVLDE